MSIVEEGEDRTQEVPNGECGYKVQFSKQDVDMATRNLKQRCIQVPSPQKLVPSNSQRQRGKRLIGPYHILLVCCQPTDSGRGGDIVSTVYPLVSP